MGTINIGLLGAGTVGGGVVKALGKRAKYFKNELGLDLKLTRIVDKDADRFAALPVDDAICSGDAGDILNDDSISIVIELAGGTGFARTFVLDALARGKHVVTANKALIAEHGPEIFEAAVKAGVSVYFEASVGGGMPVIKAIREGLIGNDIFCIRTIINGTCNYILTRMTAEGLPFDDVLKQAQEKGYAEADPVLDVEGGDTGHKTAILASLACGGYVPYGKFPIEGITKIAKEDIEFAAELGYVIKLLGVIKNATSGLDIRVHPAMLHKGHILASVSDVFNAVLLEGDAVGQILIYGRGAGEMPTASAVVSDIVDVARNIKSDSPIRIPMDYYRRDREIGIIPTGQGSGRYYLRFTVCDTPGVLASISSRLSDAGISVASVMQKEGAAEGSVPLIIITHSAPEHGVRKAIMEIEKEQYIRAETRLIRIED
ncbi:MAG: homoserine dehydrogenase [Chitinispirillales bacterium]|jgi:homoserine dehydrogenase|nr:homoserine dehydrogenase [Chitinispirillales bacterium]